MSIGKIITGILLIIAGAGLAIFVPPLLEKRAEDVAEVDRLFDATAISSLEKDQKFIFTGKVSRGHPRLFEHDMVVGVRMHQKATRKKRKKKTDRARRDERESTRMVVDEEYTQPLLIRVEGVDGLVEVQPRDIHPLEGRPWTKKGGTKEDPLEWAGVKENQIITARAEILRVNPIKARVLRGRHIFVGPHDKMLKEQARDRGRNALLFRAGGGLLALVGVGFIVYAFWRRR